jgi:prepilin-type N-terminal cleavage/methylation domain-containing protein
MNHKTAQVKPIKCTGRGILRTAHGFTLVEVITVLVIISLLAVFAAPEVINWRPKMRLKSAADTLAENLQRAKMHAIKNNVRVEFFFTNGIGTPCKDGKYEIKEFPPSAVVVVPEVQMTNNICLQATNYADDDGFTSRGLSVFPANPGNPRSITISNADLNNSGDPTYVITQSVAGGLDLQKVLLP